MLQYSTWLFLLIFSRTFIVLNNKLVYRWVGGIKFLSSFCSGGHDRTSLLLALIYFQLSTAKQMKPSYSVQWGSKLSKFLQTLFFCKCSVSIFHCVLFLFLLLNSLLLFYISIIFYIFSFYASLPLPDQYCRLQMLLLLLNSLLLFYISIYFYILPPALPPGSPTLALPHVPLAVLPPPSCRGHCGSSSAPALSVRL